MFDCFFRSNNNGGNSSIGTNKKAMATKTLLYKYKNVFIELEEVEEKGCPGNLKYQCLGNHLIIFKIKS